MAKRARKNRLRWYVAEWRKQLKMTQESVAAEIGTNKGQISKLETGDQRMNDDWAVAFSKVLGIDIPNLLRDPNALHPLDRAFAAARRLPEAEQHKVIGYIESKINGAGDVLSMPQEKPPSKGIRDKSRSQETEPGHLGLEVARGLEAAGRSRKKDASLLEQSEDRKPPSKVSPPPPRKS